MISALLLPHLLFFDPERAGRRERQVRSTVADQPKRETRLLCAACRQVVTYPIQRMSARGSHEHACTNPHGITYRIGCFREACGCVTLGGATTEFTWFAGYAWVIALCSKCHAHLGWRFQSAGDSFYGLILDRLIMEQPVDDASGGR